MMLPRRSVLSSAVVLLALAGCPDPRARIDEFADRVARMPDGALPDASLDAPPLEVIPDVTGTFLLDIEPSFAAGTKLEFLATTTLTQNGDGTATLDMTMLALSVADRLPVGDPQVSNGILVAETGEFDAPYPEVTLPGEANPISGSIIIGAIELHGIIKNEDLFCGVATGDLTSPGAINLDGSTWAAIRVPAGTQGADLPTGLIECPPDLPDAGPPDAAGPDAATPDAPTPDAPAPDAETVDAEVADA